MVVTPESTLIDLDAPADVATALVRIGRVEDVSFSPRNDRIALVCLDRNTIAVGELTITDGSERPVVSIPRIDEFSAPAFRTPHGVEFVDDEHVLVASRYGRVAAFHIPRRAGRAATSEPIPLTPLDVDPFELLQAPGAVRVVQHESGRIEALVCDNKRSVVTTHELLLDPLRVTSSRQLLRRYLDYPDGISVSADRKWIAISNHDAHVVLVYGWTSSLTEESEPDAVLRGTIYPHGLQLTPDGRELIVADAGRPFVNVYERSGESWEGVRYPDASIPVMSDEVYARGRDHESRGPKGVSIDRSGRVMAVTFERQPIAFFDLALAVREHKGRGEARDLRYELEALEDVGVRVDEARATLMSSRSYRVMQPFRTLGAAVRSRLR